MDSMGLGYLHGSPPKLGGGFKYFLFLLPREMIQIHYYFSNGFNPLSMGKSGAMNGATLRFRSANHYNVDPYEL